MSRAALAAWGAAFAFTAACGGSGGEAMPAYGGPPDEEVEPPGGTTDDTAEDEVEAPVEDGEATDPPEEGATEEDVPVPAYGGPPEG